MSIWGPRVVVDAEGFVELRQGCHQRTDDHRIFSQVHRAEDGAAKHLCHAHARAMPDIIPQPNMALLLAYIGDVLSIFLSIWLFADKTQSRSETLIRAEAGSEGLGLRSKAHSCTALHGLLATRANFHA